MRSSRRHASRLTTIDEHQDFQDNNFFKMSKKNRIVVAVIALLSCNILLIKYVLFPMPDPGVRTITAPVLNKKQSYFATTIAHVV
jgi:hypothetical protein